jgi:maltose alpha-D-glucosyltransferase/alpha-amylase
MERKIRMRKECPEISWGDWAIVRTNAASVLAMRFEWSGQALFILHNFSEKPQAISLDARAAGDRTLIDLLATNDSRANESGRHVIELPPYAYRWYRAGRRQ